TGEVRAVDDVSFHVHAGETLALVGESGSGKTTTGRAVLRLVEPTDGRIHFRGIDVRAQRGAALRALRRHLQIVFQDPWGSLNPRLTAGAAIREGLAVHRLARGAEAARRVAQLLEEVGLPAEAAARYPHEFSGGQRQRIGIARALSVEPELIVADEPVSALDVSVQAQIVNLLQDLQAEKGFSYLFIAHDLAVVRHVADRIMVMYLGRVVEIGPKRTIYAAPQHPYTQALLSAVPEPDPDATRRRIILQGDVPSPTRVPPGCHFHTRCPLAQPDCRTERPALRRVAEDQWAACHFAAPNPIPV
ncbi:MAG: ABC transporter ATP-binding protein, partial [Acetobacteraceae bacterium]